MEEERINLSGQWFGCYTYGPEYGEFLDGQSVSFSLLISEVFNNKFKGQSIELEGIGASEELARVEGFIENRFVSFVKEYKNNGLIDEDGNLLPAEDKSANRVLYNGNYYPPEKKFVGTWEIWANEEPFGDGAFVTLSTGTWEISRDGALYGIE